MLQQIMKHHLWAKAYMWMHWNIGIWSFSWVHAFTSFKFIYLFFISVGLEIRLIYYESIRFLITLWLYMSHISSSQTHNSPFLCPQWEHGSWGVIIITLKGQRSVVPGFLFDRLPVCCWGRVSLLDLDICNLVLRVIGWMWHEYCTSFHRCRRKKFNEEISLWLLLFSLIDRHY